MSAANDLKGKTILVTGASSGIGRAVAVYVADQGASVIISGRNEKRLREVLGSLNGEGNALASFDLSDVNAIPEWLKRLSDKHGKLGAIVHCAGSELTMPIRFIDKARLEEHFSVNFNAAFHLSRGFRQKSVYAGRGSSIVYLSSIMGLVGAPGLSAYGASKGALISLVRSLAMELARDGIRVNCVSPGYVRTELLSRLEEALGKEKFEAIEKKHPLGFGQPEDIAFAVAFLLAETGRWITGTTLVVDGGYTAQ